MLVEPGVEVDRVEPDQPAYPYDRDPPLLNEPADVPDAGAEQLGHRLDVEQPPAINDGSGSDEGEFG